jgi:hypothetical protein
MQVNDQVKNTVAGLTGVIGGEIIYNALKGDAAWAEENNTTVVPQETTIDKNNVETEIEKNPIETQHHGSVFDLKYEENNFNPVDAENALTSLLDEPNPVSEESSIIDSGSEDQLSQSLVDETESFSDSFDSTNTDMMDDNVLAMNDVGITDQDLGLA